MEVSDFINIITEVDCILSQVRVKQTVWWKNYGKPGLHESLVL